MNKPTDKCPYLSKYSPEKHISELQYIVEFVCERRAKSLGKDLPNYFWNLPEWKSYYMSQLRATQRLITKYSGRIILSVLKANGGIYSLRAKWVEKLMIQEYNKVSLDRQTSTSVEVDVVENPKIVSAPLKNNPRKRLMDLDNEQKEN